MCTFVSCFKEKVNIIVIPELFSRGFILEID